MTIKTDIRTKFWEKYPLSQLTRSEWESLCDGCGKCCLLKLEDDETGAVHYTSLACRLFDDTSCRCANYPLRRMLVPGCVALSLDTIEEAAEWLPPSCAYKRRYEGKSLPSWHPLLTGSPKAMHQAGASVQHKTIPEYDVDEEEYEDYIISEA